MLVKRKRKFTKRKRFSNYRKRRFQRRKDMPYAITVRDKTYQMNGPFPQIYRCKMEIHDSFRGDIGSFSFYTYVGNSVYDPYFGQGGGQPNGFKELSVIYQLYRVYASSIQVTCIDPNANQVLGVTTFPATSPVSPAAYSSYPDAAEQPFAQNMLIGPSGGISKGTNKIFMTTKKIWGKTSLGEDDRFFASTQGSPSKYPTNAWFWNIWIANIYDASANVTAIFDIKVVYYVEFSNQFVLSSSVNDPDGAGATGPVPGPSGTINQPANLSVRYGGSTGIAPK